MARSKTPFVRPRIGVQPGALGRLVVKLEAKAEITSFKSDKDLKLANDLLVSDSELFVCKVGEGIVGDTSPMGEGKLIPFHDHVCSVYRNNTGVCLLCGSEAK